MATIINDLKGLFKRGEIHIRLIFVNVTVFLVFTLVQIVLMLFNISINDWLQWLEIPASLPQFLRQPWSIVTYMFMHAGVMHLLFNMLWLYWFGKLFLYFFSARHLRGVYLWGGICGGLPIVSFLFLRPMSITLLWWVHLQLFWLSWQLWPIENPTIV